VCHQSIVSLLPFRLSQMFVRLTLNSLSLWERGGQLFTANSLEDWYTTNIWCRVLDDCFLTLPHVILQRYGSICLSFVWVDLC
jgi:hypothetical protein